MGYNGPQESLSVENRVHITLGDILLGLYAIYRYIYRYMFHYYFVLHTSYMVFYSQSFAKALNRPAFLPVPESILNFLLNNERAMIMTKGQHVIPRRVLEYGFKYRYDNIDEACNEFAHLCPKKHPLK